MLIRSAAETKFGVANCKFGRTGRAIFSALRRSLRNEDDLYGFVASPQEVDSGGVARQVDAAFARLL